MGVPCFGTEIIALSSEVERLVPKADHDLCYNILMKKHIVDAAKKRILYLPHAVAQMSRAERMISVAEVEKCVFEGEVIEQYPDDPRGESCLVAHINGRPIHVVCAPKADYLAVITAYLPDPSLWAQNYTRRRT